MTGQKWKNVLLFLWIGCIVMLMNATGCGLSEPAEMDGAGIAKYLNELESYETQASVTFYSNKNENTYLVQQQVCRDGRYRMEIREPAEFAGVTTISDGQTVVQSDPSIQGTVKAKNTPVRDALLLYTFLACYTPSEETFVRQEDGSALLTAPYNTEMDKLASGRLRFNIATQKPEMLEILDKDGNPSLRIVYQSFEGNKTFDEGLFQTTGQKEESQNSGS